MSLQPIKIGDIVKTIAIERFKASTGAKYIGSIISRDINASNTHYMAGVGSFHCFRGVCCEKYGIPMVRYILPLLEYTVTKFPSEYGTPVNLKHLAIGKKDYEDGFLLKDQINKDITTKDITVTCSEGQYQNLSFEVLGDAKWRKETSMLEEVMKMLQDYKQLIDLSVARSITPAQFEEFYAVAQTLPQRNNQRRLPQGQPPQGHRQLSQGRPAQTQMSPLPPIQTSVNPAGDGDFDDLLEK